MGARWALQLCRGLQSRVRPSCAPSQHSSCVDAATGASWSGRGGPDPHGGAGRRGHSALRPPLAHGAHAPRAIRGSDTLLAWARSVLEDAPARSFPLVIGDFNTQVGIDEDNTRWPRAVGPHWVGRPSPVPPPLRDWLLSSDLQVVNSHFASAGPTFFSNHGTPSTLTILVPSDLLRRIRSLRVVWRAGRQLQLTPSAAPRDHVPLVMEVRCGLCFPPRPSGIRAWDFGLLAAAFQTGHMSANRRYKQHTCERLRNHISSQRSTLSTLARPRGPSAVLPPASRHDALREVRDTLRRGTPPSHAPPFPRSLGLSLAG